ncbi:caspase family protein [Nannocystis pusilla]|uniref:Caspase family protein n=1 Tax=Nannocystis pusilla TaxID=889268 RepID=A0ABS7TPB4_9BACT|nr:caspase family protein [Nannocystis pusilla]MBZ5710073.1 caspase family protein [Nannocystis pusilla]
MTHRALLLGAAYGSLLHVPRSLDRLEAALGKHGFRPIERHLDLAPEALLARLERFAATVEVGDAVAVVYVGHGGHRHGLGYLRPSPGLRPVVGLELGARLAALLPTTSNVTLVLDCCHAAGVLEDPSHLDATALCRMVAAQCERIDRFEALPDEAPLEHVVQLLAAAAPENALEDHERACGLFSSALADVLEHCVGSEVAWHEVLDEMRLRMRTRPGGREQSPTLGGRHARRVPFSERESSLNYDDFACTLLRSGIHVEAGALAGITPTDRFAMRALGTPLGAAAPLASVTELGPDHAVLTPDGDSPPLPLGLPLRAVRTMPTRHPPPSRWQQLLDAIALSPRLPPAAFALRWGHIDHDTLTQLPEEGGRIGSDDDLWIAFGTRRSKYAYRLYFAVFHLGPDGRLTPLSPAHPQGLMLPCDHDFLLASRLAHGLAHADTLAWSKGQPPGAHALVVLISDRPIAVDTIARSIHEAFADPLAPPTTLYALARMNFSVIRGRVRDLSCHLRAP